MASELRQRVGGGPAVDSPTSASTLNGSTVSTAPDKPIKRDPKLAVAFLVCWLVLASYMASLKRRMALPLGFCVVFLFFNQVVQPVTLSLWPGYAALAQAKKYSWNNLCVALLHAATESVLCVLILAVNWSDFASNFNWLRPSMPITPLPYIAVSLSLGYCAVDTYDMIQSGEARTAFYLIVHHTAILVAFTISLYNDLGVWYLVLNLLCEINTVFLHIRVLLRHMGFRRPDTVYRTAWRLLFTTMYVFRLPVHALILVRVLMDRFWWPTDMLWTIGCGCMVIFNVLNFDLNRNLSKAYRRERQTASSKRVRAVTFLSDWLWPILGLVGVMVYGFCIRKHFPSERNA